MRLAIEFEVPTLDQIYEMLLSLAGKIRKNGFLPDMLVGISCGGWPAARVMADLLGDSKLTNVGVEFYLGVAETKKEALITQPVSMSVQGRKISG